MAIKNKLLSIVIPTYNRIKFLETEISCFIKQITESELEDVVEILISDDASEDDSSKYIKQISSEYGFIHGWSNQKNLGFSENVDHVVNKAQGKYVLISGDDDLMRDGAISYFVKCIKEKNPNFILINTSNILSLDNSNKKYEVIVENRLNINRNIYIENFQKDHALLKDAKNWLYLTNLLPAVIFRKDLYQTEKQTALKYVKLKNVYLWQAQVLIGISKYGKFLVISYCYILHRKNETNWTKNPQGIANININDSSEIGKLLLEYMPSEYREYKKLFAAFTMGELINWTGRNIGVRKFAWDALRKNLYFFPKNIQFLGMVIAPKLIIRFSQLLKSLK